MIYTEEDKIRLVNLICMEISNGKSLRSILRMPDTPDGVTFYKWIDGDEEWIKQYTRACEERASGMFEDILTIADSQEHDIIIVDGKEVTNHDVIIRAKLRIDSRKWMLGKMMPKKYGDKLDLSSSDGSMNSKPVFVFKNLNNDKEEE